MIVSHAGGEKTNRMPQASILVSNPLQSPSTLVLCGIDTACVRYRFEALNYSTSRNTLCMWERAKQEVCNVEVEGW